METGLNPEVLSWIKIKCKHQSIKYKWPCISVHLLHQSYVKSNFKLVFACVCVTNKGRLVLLRQGNFMIFQDRQKFQDVCFGLGWGGMSKGKGFYFHICMACIFHLGEDTWLTMRLRLWNYLWSGFICCLLMLADMYDFIILSKIVLGSLT